MTSSAPARTTCPRCEKPLVRNHDVLECLVHGTIEEPVLAWDLPSAAGVELEAGRARRRGASHKADVVPWTAEERRVWDEWKEGDPVPFEEPEVELERKMELSGAAAVTIQSAEQLAGACQARVDAIDRELAGLERMTGKLRDERKRLGQVVALLRGEPRGAKREAAATAPTGAFECDECSRVFDNMKGRSMHKTRSHGPGWDSSGNLKGRPA